MLDVTFAAVAKVIIAVLIGAYASQFIPYRDTAMADFGFLIGAIPQPALTISNTSKSVDLNVLIHCSILIIMSVVLSSAGVVMLSCCFGTRNMSVRQMLLLLLPHARREKSKFLLQVFLTLSHHRVLGVPYVAVRLSKAWQQAGVTARDVVPHLTAPTPESDYTGAYGWSSYVVFGILNMVTLPPVLTRELDFWITVISFEASVAYTFVFSILPTVYTWSFGPFFVKKARRETKKRRYIRLLLEEHLTRRHLSDAATQTGPEAADGEDTDLSAATAAAAAAAGYCERFPYDWESAGLVRMYCEHMQELGEEVRRGEKEEEMADDSSQISEAPCYIASSGSPTSPRYDVVAELLTHSSREPPTHNQHHPPMCRRSTTPQATTRAKLCASTKHQRQLLLKNPPFMSIIIGMVIGLVPALHDAFFDGGPLEMLMDATALVGQGNIPCALMMLGASLAGTGGLSAGGESEAADVTNPLRAAGCRLQRSGERQMRHAGTGTTEDEAAATDGTERNGRGDRAFDLHRDVAVRCEGRLVHVHHGGCSPDIRFPVAFWAEEEAPSPGKPSTLQSVMAMASLKGIRHFFVFGVMAGRLLVISLIMSYLMVVGAWR
eukprot:gene6991-4955_t